MALVADNRHVIPAPMKWFLRLWAVAILAHIAGNPPGWREAAFPAPLGVVSLVLGVTAIVVLLAPGRLPAMAMAALTVASVVLEAPFVGNHWIVAGLVSILLMVALVRSEPWPAFAPGARGILLTFYSFAAFAKLNAGFFDPVASCGITYANQMLGSYGLPLLPSGGGVAIGVAAATALIELSVPVLLLIRRTRYWGVLVGLVFHGLISFDLDQHFYDFSGLLIALFFLFLADHLLATIPETWWVRTPYKAVGAGLLALVVVAAVVEPRRITALLLEQGVFLVWIPWVVLLTWRLIKLGRRTDSPTVSSVGRFGLVGTILVTVTIANGLTPYLELKTGYGFNMYANLVTADGRSNHFLIPRTLPLTDAQRDPYIVLESDDPGLHQYVDSGWAVTEDRLLHYLAKNPDATATVTRVVSGGERRLSGADGRRLPWWREKFQLFRAIDLNDPPRCQLVWLPAR